MELLATLMLTAITLYVLFHVIRIAVRDGVAEALADRDARRAEAVGDDAPDPG